MTIVADFCSQTILQKSFTVSCLGPVGGGEGQHGGAMSKLTQRVQPWKAYTLPRHKTGPATWKLAVQFSRIWVAMLTHRQRKRSPEDFRGPSLVCLS